MPKLTSPNIQQSSPGYVTQSQDNSQKPKKGSSSETSFSWPFNPEETLIVLGATGVGIGYAVDQYYGDEMHDVFDKTKDVIQDVGDFIKSNPLLAVGIGVAIVMTVLSIYLEGKRLDKEIESNNLSPQTNVKAAEREIPLTAPSPGSR